MSIRAHAGRAAVAAAVVVALLTGAAIAQAPARINHRFPTPATSPANNAHITRTPLPARDLFQTYVSRDWLRSPLDLPSAPPTPQPTQNRESNVAPPALDPSVEPAGQTAPSPRVTDLPRPSVSATPSGSSGTSPGEANLTGPRAYARTLVASAAQWLCLDQLWGHESGWRANADNPDSSAYGIAQRLDETSHDPDVQIDNGLAYIKSRYGSPCDAWAHWQRNRWY